MSGNDFEHRFHFLYMPGRAYTCQAIFSRDPGNGFSLRTGMHSLDHHVKEWICSLRKKPTRRRAATGPDRNVMECPQRRALRYIPLGALQSAII